MRLGIIASQQFSNPYTGQGTSEGAQMRKVVEQLGDRWKSRGIDVSVGPDFDFNKDGTRSHKDNVRWENFAGPFDLLLSFHSNAAGDSMVLWGTSTKSANYGKRIMDALNADNPFPGDAWTYYPRKVSELVDTKSPTVLLELSRHDWAAQAADLVRRIADGSLSAHLDRVLSRALGLPAPTEKGNIVTDIYAYPGVILGRYPNGKGTRVDRHPAVFTLQAMLGVRQDGVFGPATETAVKEFQRAHGLTPDDGIVGRDTWAKLVGTWTKPVEVPAPAPAPAPTPEPTPAPEPAPVSPVDLGAIVEAVRQAVRESVLQALDDYEADSDPRVEAWSLIAKHPFFADCYATDGALIDAMLAKLDEASGA